MERETVLAGGAVVVLAVAALFVVTAPGALADATPDPPPSELTVREQTIAAGNVTGGTATLTIDSRLEHRGGPSENVTVLVRAVDRDTDLVAATTDREVPVAANVSVPRDGDYRIQTVVYADGERVAGGRKTVNGVGGLQPHYARTGVTFHRFEGFSAAEMPSIQFSIAEATGSEATLNVTAYLTNTGDRENEGLDVTFLARQADSNIVADRRVRRVGANRPGRTATPSTRLSVPDDYNYRLVAIVQHDDVVVGTAQAPATLNPNRTVTVDRNESSDTLDTGDFETEGTEEPDRVDLDGSDDGDRPGTSSGDGAGFGPVVALLAVLATAAIARRNR
jgi:PGF-CTERM protein